MIEISMTKAIQMQKGNMTEATGIGFIIPMNLHLKCVALFAVITGLYIVYATNL
jgi:hypothetical protein